MNKKGFLKSYCVGLIAGSIGGVITFIVQVILGTMLN